MSLSHGVVVVMVVVDALSEREGLAAGSAESSPSFGWSNCRTLALVCCVIYVKLLVCTKALALGTLTRTRGGPPMPARTPRYACSCKPPPLTPGASSPCSAWWTTPPTTRLTSTTASSCTTRCAHTLVPTCHKQVVRAHLCIWGWGVGQQGCVRLLGAYAAAHGAAAAR